MNRNLLRYVSVCSLALLMANGMGMDLPLPAGVKAVWDVDKAWRETTPTRERICINGLWAWQPAKPKDAAVPTEGWGALKVPAPWPGGGGNWMTEESQVWYPHLSWKDVVPANAAAGWYQRDITVPKDWAGRKISLSLEFLNSSAIVHIDGQKAGEIGFPSGELDITALCPAGTTHALSILASGGVGFPGLSGDVFLVGVPAKSSVGDVKIDTSFRKGEIALDTRLDDVDAAATYSLRAVITDQGATVREFTSKAFKGDELKNGRISVSEQWKADKLWDTHTPQNMYHLQLSLLDADGKVLDAYAPIRFGFREMWIDGRDFYLNGTRIFLSSVPLDNGLTGVADATYEAAKESMLRLKTFGMNFLYTHNYGCTPGSHISQRALLRAADDAGMLIALTQPHFWNYKWEDADADEQYLKLAEFYVRTAQNHPSVVAYSTSHNSSGNDMDPDKIDGLNVRTDIAKQLHVGELINRIDPSRIVYHHESGNMGSMITDNWYPNFTPAQEISDWFEHWSTKGVKPMFMCEYNAPLSRDFAMFRGWFEGEMKYSGAVAWELCVAEWCSQFFGDRAFQSSELEKACLRMESKKLKSGVNKWNHWDYPQECTSSNLFTERMEVWGRYYEDNFRAFRTWGVSATSPWEHNLLFDVRDGINTGRIKGVPVDRKELTTDWDALQRPGFSPDYITRSLGHGNQRMDLAFERTDWIPNAAGRAIIRNNIPLLAYIGGKAAAFTSKDHHFLPGESAEKQLIIINNSRETVECECSWSLDLPQPVSGTKKVSIKTGDQERIVLRFDLPTETKPGMYALSASVKFSNGETQQDSFALRVMPAAAPVKLAAKIALFDPKGETGKWLAACGVEVKTIDAKADLAGFDLLIIGKAALTLDGEAPDVAKVRDGLRVIIFEQESTVLEKRFGFRVQEYGLRSVFKRTPDHPILAGLETDQLRDWRGSATIVPERSANLHVNERKTPPMSTWWCDIDSPRTWRCGNRGNVASVLIERPACGDFLSLIDGGYSLQYSPLLEYHEGKGLILFCQMDVTGRSESEPAAEALSRNILNYVAAWKPSPTRTALYVGEAAGKAHLEKSGIAVAAYGGGALKSDQVLIVGPGGGAQLAAHAADIATWLKAGGKALVIGLDETEANAFLPFKIATKKAEHIAAYFEAQTLTSGLAGVGPADVHNRDPREMPLITGGATALGDGVLATAEGSSVVFYQMVPWQFVYTIPQNIKRTFRRTSCAVTRLLGNMGVGMTTPLLKNIKTPVEKSEKRFLTGFYLDVPEEWDDPYRYFPW